MKILYKCRLCGTIYSDTSSSKDTAYFIAENLCTSEEVTIHGMNVKRHDLHICEQGNPSKFGFADFIGIVGDKNNENKKSEDIT